MKKRLAIIFSLFFALFILPNVVFSQERDTVWVPDEWDSGDGNGSTGVGVLNRFIMEDTLAGGVRKHPNCVYMLTRGKFYSINSRLYVDFNFDLEAPPDDPNNSTRPPIVYVMKNAQGDHEDMMFSIQGDSTYFVVKNILFQGVWPDQFINTEGQYMAFVYGSFHRIVMDNCITHGFKSSVFAPRSSDRCSFFITNNIHYNNFELQGVGGGSFSSNTMKYTYYDTVIYRNNTFFNNGGNNVLDWEFCDYYEFTHNTMYNTSINGLWIPYMTNAKFNDNLFFDYQTVGETEWEYINGHWDKGTPRHGHASILKLNLCDPQVLIDHRMEESGRKVEAKNNVYFWSQTIRDFWENTTSQKDIDMGYTGEVRPVTWINAITDSMFHYGWQGNEYPNLVEENNVELDPGFDPTMQAAVLDKEIPFITLYRQYGWTTLEGAQERYYNPTYTQSQDDLDLFNLKWPLELDLTYTNEAVLTAAQGGFPAGDLNWYPDKKAEWEEWVTAVEDKRENTNVINGYSLSQNYPNPFNPKTDINFQISQPGRTSLIVYNVLGQEVATLVDKDLRAGNYKFTFDASHLSSGIYFYKLQSKSFSQIKKMMLIK